MANCKVCNVEVPDGTDICDDCRRKLVKNDEQYLDQLLAAVTGNSTEPYQQTEDHADNTPNHENEYEPISYTQEEIDRQNSKDDDWNLLNQTITKQQDKKADALEYDLEYDKKFDNDIPVEGALDEVDSILMDDYGSVLQEIADGLDTDSDHVMANEQYSQPDYDQGDYFDYIVSDGILGYQDEIMDIPDELVEEDMHNSLVNQEVMDNLDEDMSVLYDTQANLEPAKNDLNKVTEVEKINEVDEIVEADRNDEVNDIIEASRNDEVDDIVEADKIDEVNDILKADRIDEVDDIMEASRIDNVDESKEADIIDDVDKIMEADKIDEVDDNAFLASLLDNDLQDSSLQTNDFQDDALIDEVREQEASLPSDSLKEQEVVEPTIDNSEPKLELDDELSELDKLLEEVTEKADDYKLDSIVSTDSLKEESSKKINTSDVLSKSLSAVSGLDDPSLEEQFNNILPNEKPTETPKKVSFFKRMFGNIPPENPELELQELEENEKSEEEKKQLKLEAKQKKEAQKEENKAKKVAKKEDKQKILADEKLKRQKAREAIAAAYVPEGKINRAGATVVFVMATFVAILIIQGTSLASYQISIKSAEKDFKNARYDEAYETLSGETLKKKDEVVYDKLQTIMVVKKELNSYYNFKKMNMELEALDAVIKGIDRYERYYANAKELKVDSELDSLKKQLLSILKTNYQLSEKDVNKLNKIEDAKLYTDKLTSIVDKVIDHTEDTKQMVQKNK